MKYTATILIADGTPDSSGHSLDSELVTWPKDGVPVRMGVADDAPVVGHAVLSLEGFSVVAEVELDSDKLGDLTEEQVDALVPAVVGMGNEEEFDLEVQGIALGDWQNADERITALRPLEHDCDAVTGLCTVCGFTVLGESAAPCPGPPAPIPITITPNRLDLDTDTDTDMPVSRLLSEVVDIAGELGKDIPFVPAELSDEAGRPLQKRDPVPDGCEDCPGCPDCLEYVPDGEG